MNLFDKHPRPWRLRFHQMGSNPVTIVDANGWPVGCVGSEDELVQIVNGPDAADDTSHLRARLQTLVIDLDIAESRRKLAEHDLERTRWLLVIAAAITAAAISWGILSHP
jgi:hypothetical protein